MMANRQKLMKREHGKRFRSGGPAVKRAEPAIRLALGEEKSVPGLPTQMGSEDFQDLASPHPAAKILHVRIGCGPPSSDGSLVMVTESIRGATLG